MNRLTNGPNTIRLYHHASTSPKTSERLHQANMLVQRLVHLSSPHTSLHSNDNAALAPHRAPSSSEHLLAPFDQTAPSAISKSFYSITKPHKPPDQISQHNFSLLQLDDPQHSQHQTLSSTHKKSTFPRALSPTFGFSIGAIRIAGILLCGRSVPQFCTIAHHYFKHS